MKNFFPLFFITAILLNACNGVKLTATADAVATSQTVSESTQTAEPVLETTSRLNVNEEARKGLNITVWVPWYGLESDLFNTFVKEFNSQNEWGVQVNVENQVNFTNLYETVTAALPRD